MPTSCVCHICGRRVYIFQGSVQAHYIPGTDRAVLCANSNKLFKDENKNTEAANQVPLEFKPIELTDKIETKHTWIDGPHGWRYHCANCGISKTNDYSFYDTCELWQAHVADRTLPKETLKPISRRGSDTMTNDELKALCDAATAGQWGATWHKMIWEHRVETPDETICSSVGEYDAAFIAAARTEVPRLLEDVERLEAALRVELNNSENVTKQAAQLKAQVQLLKQAMYQANQILGLNGEYGWAWDARQILINAMEGVEI